MQAFRHVRIYEGQALTGTCGVNMKSQVNSSGEVRG